MSTYVDGFVIPLSKDKIGEYREIAEQAGAIWREHGALDYYECIGDDMEAKDMVSFPQLAGAEPGETVAFSWIVYKSREHRDEVNAKVMADPRLKGDMPFDAKRLIFGGFEMWLEM